MSFAVALHVMLVLARNTHRRMNSNQIAASVGSNPVTVRRVMSSLVASDLIDTQTGPGGGATLAKPADKITASDIHEAIGHPSWIHEHGNAPNMKCDVSVSMPRILHRLDQAIDRCAASVLGKVTLKTLLDQEILRK